VIQAELLDENLKAIPGFGRDDCRPFEGDEKHAPVTWQDRVACPHDGVHARFHITRAMLCCGGFIPEILRGDRMGGVKAKASVVIVESADGKHAAALGFRQSYAIFSNPDNRCFHADPYFGPITESGEERLMRGKLYLMAGSATDAFERYREDFERGQRNRKE